MNPIMRPFRMALIWCRRYRQARQRRAEYWRLLEIDHVFDLARELESVKDEGRKGS